MKKNPLNYILALLMLGAAIPSQSAIAQGNINIQELGEAQKAVDIQELVVLTGDEATTDEMFGPQMGNIHGFVSVAADYTDNVYNLDVDEQTNLLVTISPGIWLIAPKAERIPLRLSSYNTAVGGSRFTLPGSGSFDRFQTYLLAGLDYKMHSVESDLDYTAWGVEGMFQYKLPAGISFRIMDKFISDRDRIEIGSFRQSDFTEVNGEIQVNPPDRIREFISNQAVGFINFDMSEKFAAMFTYTNFYLDYDDPEDHWLDRMDNVFSLDLRYNHSPKTSFFAEGRFSLTDYDTADYNDSNLTSLYGGISWHKSIKTQLLFKAGYHSKSFEEKTVEDIEREDLSGFSMETWINYRYSDKTNMSFKLMKAIEETDTALSRGKDAISSRFFFNHDFTPRLRTNIELRYEDYKYDEYTIVGESRDEYIIGIKPSLEYDFRKWLGAELAYSYENRDSNIDLYDFTTQTVYLSLNAAF